MAVSKRSRIHSRTRDEQGRKYCSTCDDWLDETHFGRSVSSPDLLQHCCKSCRKSSYVKDRESVLGKRLLDAFGLTSDDLRLMIERQGSVCAACKNPADRWVVDHDHACCPGRRTCGRCIRGAICSHCNMAMGLAQDDPQRLRAMADYLDYCRPQPKLIKAGDVEES